MRAFFLATLFLALGAGGSGASASEVFDDRLQEISRIRSTHDHGGSHGPRTRLARATLNDEEEYDYYRPRAGRDDDDADDDDRPRRSKHRTLVKRHGARHHAVVKREQRAAVKHKQRASIKRERRATHAGRAPRTPTWTPRSLSTQGPVGSGVTGVASYYWERQRLASGGWFDPSGMTAAHKTLPFGTRVRVTHLGNGRSVEVRINDRGPYVAGRIIDLSRAAANIIGMTGQGVARVKMQILGR
jgi:rare lipoprotein A